ncbi:CAP domain-containing protein [Paucisalibacillus globulus]|jgi:uncharacterized YkwD family protein|uniref:CAP domain-containing protein n=1 Tax=Paucisalibacillus globulus TaxID=351095 RepID=UPI000411B6E7|nr:CAP domain-containing protein [Paucisalibacillus globulus]
MKGKLVKLFIAFFVVIVLTACNNDDAGSDNDNNSNNGNDNISSMSTDQSSNDYPHTQPIKTQDAKYKFTPQQGKNEQPGGDNVPNTNNITNKQQATPQQQQQKPQQAQQQTENHGLSQFESDVVALTNKERTQAGLSTLQVDTKLSQVAREKSNDMQKNGYFSHTSPTYGSPFDMMRDFGITYRSAGENIAQGQSSPAEVVQAWMNSQGHRENILNANFTHIGVGYNTQGKQWTQMFITK